MNKTTFPSNTLFEVKIKTRFFEIHEKDITKERAILIIKDAVRNNPDDKELMEANIQHGPASSLFGFSGTSRGEFNFHISSYLPVIINEEDTQTCPRRINSLFGNWSRAENLDKWEKRGKDRCCSFCGSMHPDEFIEFVKSNGFSKIEKAYNKDYKYYVNQDGVPNAGFGAIKFYVWHLSEEQINEYNELVIKHKENILNEK